MNDLDSISMEKEQLIGAEQNATMKQNMKDILLDISWAHLSKKYFGKSRSWLYHKMDGVGGDFTDAEKVELRNALNDLAARINLCADKIK